MPERRGRRGSGRTSVPKVERSYSRVDRVGRAIAQVVADELEVIGDERLELVTVTGVRVEPGLRHALVWYSAQLSPDPALVVVALSDYRIRVQAAIARELHLRRTPELAFHSDPAIEKGTRVEEILRGLHHDDSYDDSNAEDPGNAERLGDEHR